MRLYVIRHGETEWNAQRRIQGDVDIPLADSGKALAAKVGQALKEVPFDLCFTSPLTRARQTAELVLGDRAGTTVPLIPDKRIQEINFGVLEGRRYKDGNGNVLCREMDIFFTEPQNYQRPENGESIPDVLARTREFWNEKTKDPSLQDKTILIASHGCASRALMQNVFQDDPAHFWHGCVPPNCSVCVVEVHDGQAVLLEQDKVYA